MKMLNPKVRIFCIIVIVDEKMEQIIKPHIVPGAWNSKYACIQSIKELYRVWIPWVKTRETPYQYIYKSDSPFVMMIQKWDRYAYYLSVWKDKSNFHYNLLVEGSVESKMYEYDMELGEISKTSGKIFPNPRQRCWFWPSINRRRVYAVGGLSKEGEYQKNSDYLDLEDCFATLSEGTDIASKWRAMSTLNIGRGDPIVCEFVSSKNKKWLFWFGGRVKNKITGYFRLENSTERISVEDEEAWKWEKLKIKLPRRLSHAAAFQLSVTQIWIAGGWTENEDLLECRVDKEESHEGKLCPIKDLPKTSIRCNDEAYIFDVTDSDLQLAKTLKLDFPDTFKGNIIKNEDSLNHASPLTLVGTNRIHLFDLIKQKFSSYPYVLRKKKKNKRVTK
jgi:hypothetical protein